MDKKLFINLQGGRKISGTLRGFDIFLNLVIDEAVEENMAAQKHSIGQVVNMRSSLPFVVITFTSTGNSRQQRDVYGDLGGDTMNCRLNSLYFLCIGPLEMS